MNRNIAIIILIVIFGSCKKAYNPPAIEAPNNYLVVDGYVNLSPNSITTFILSRSRNLVDTVINIPELNAQVFVQNNQGAAYTLFDVNHTGVYSSNTLNLSLSNKYRIKIITADGHQYLSDYITGKISPPIDSLTWEQNTDVSIFINAHDPANNTHYYKWNYIETWEQIAPVQTFWVQNNGIISFADTNTQTDSCWRTVNSATILLGSTVTLSQDVVSHAPVTTLLKDDERIKTRYSILVQQVPLTLDAYNYWLIIQKNSQQLGTLFDLQPSQLIGNIISVNNPDEPVIGYIVAAASQEFRIFIDHHQVTDWSQSVQHQECNVLTVPSDPNNIFTYSYPDPDYAPWYYSSTSSLLVSRKVCIDCRTYGGENKRPLFW